MFTWLNKQGVRSDAGFEVQSLDRFTIAYRENSRQISVYVEDGFLAGMKPCVSIKPDAFAKWDSGVAIPTEQQTQILQNFKEAMEFQDIAVVVY